MMLVGPQQAHYSSSYPASTHIEPTHGKKPEPLPVRALREDAFLNYFRAGGKSVQLPCATSAAMPMDSPSVGCG